MKKILIGIVIVIVLGLLFWGGSVASNNSVAQSQNGAAVAGALSAPETFFDFGAISMKDGKVRRLFTLTNVGKEAKKEGWSLEQLVEKLADCCDER